MGLKGCRLWTMGQLDSNVQSPTSPILNIPASIATTPICSAMNGSSWSSNRGIALQVASERRTLKPVFSLDRL